MASHTSSERRHRKHSKHKHRHKHRHHHHRHRHSKHKRREKDTEKKTKEKTPEIMVDEKELQTALDQLEEEMIAVSSIGVQVIHIANSCVQFHAKSTLYSSQYLAMWTVRQRDSIHQPHFTFDPQTPPTRLQMCYST